MGDKSSTQGISGSLQDVAVADVLQFIHLGRRTGVLRLDRGEERATIGFYQGKIISAQATGAPRVGDLLLRQGLVDRRRLEEALSAQGVGASRRSLGQVLLASGLLTKGQLKAVVEEQIRQTLARLLAWDDGEFEFLPDDLSPLDDVTLYPSEVIPEAEVDTQKVLDQASRLFAEKNHQENLSPPTPPAFQVLNSEDLTRALASLEEASASSEHFEVQVFTPDDAFFARLRPLLREEGAGVRRVDWEAAGAASRPVVVLLDLRQGFLGPSEVSQLRQRFPNARAVVLLNPGQPVAPFLRAGAAMVIPAELEAVAAAVAALRGQELPAPSPTNSATVILQRLRQALGEVRSGFMAASLALNLLQILSESVERAILLLVKERELAVLGAFGRGADGQLLAQSTRHMRLPLGEAELLQLALRDGEVVRGSHQQLPLPLRRLLQDAARDEVVIFPVRGIQRVIALVVADNGQRQEPIAHWEIVELAAEQAGMAFENELLRRKLAERAPSGSPPKQDGSQKPGHKAG
jgi:hypothetical protein